MQVNRVQSSPKFTALIIKTSPNSLKQKSEDELKEIDKIGNKLKDDLYTDVVLTEGAYPVVVAKPPFCLTGLGLGRAFAEPQMYKGKFKPEKPTNQFLTVNTRWAGANTEQLKNGDEYECVCNLGSKERAMDAYEKLNSANRSIEKAATFARILERSIQWQILTSKTDSQIYLTNVLYQKYEI